MIKRIAFTLSEVLITLSVIGVVAALTLPTVLNNASDAKYRGARQKALATIGSAVKNITVTEGIGNAIDAEDFVENHLRKQIQIIKTCKNNDLRSCGIKTDTNAITTLSEPHKQITMPKKIGDLANQVSNGETIDVNSTSYGFVMSNGYSVNLFYNPNCLPDSKLNNMGQDRVCVNAIYDMNGLAMPNKVGKDIGFVAVIYPDEHVVAYAPDVYKKNAANAAFDKTSASCQALYKDLSVPNKDELLAIYYNGKLLGIIGGDYWSTSESTTELAWSQSFNNGPRLRFPKYVGNLVRCIYR